MSKPRGGRFELEWVVVSYRSLLFIGMPLFVLVAAVVVVALWSRHEVSRERVEIESRLVRVREQLASLEESREKARRVERIERELAYVEAKLLAEALVDARRGLERAEKLLSMDASGARSAEAERAELLAVEGSVQVKVLGSQDWVSARPGMSLGAGDLLQTAKGAAARYRSLDGSIADIRGDTMLRIARSRRDEVSGHTDVSVVVSSGRLTVATTELWPPGSTSIVETPDLSASMKSNSVVGIDYDPESETSAIDVVTGGAAVSTGGETVDLEGRERLARSASGVVRVRLPAVPRLTSPPGYKLLLLAELDDKLELEWESSRDAREYRVSLASSLLFTRLIREWRVRTTYVVVDALPVGSYYWRVTAIDGAGAESGPSPAGIFRIAEVAPLGDPPLLRVDSFEPLGEGLYLIEGVATPEVSLTVDDGFRVFELRAQDSGSYRHLLAIPEEGRYVVTVTARSSDGLESKVSRRVEVRLP